MVFGLGKKKTPEQPQAPAQAAKSVSLEDLPTVLRQVESPQIEEAVSAAKATKAEVDAHRKKILDLILHLESDDLNLDDVDRNLGVIVKRGKNAVVSTIKKETTSALTSASKYEQAVLLNAEINQMLKKIGDVLGLNSRIIHIFAKKYADSLKEEIAKVARSRNQLQSSINTVEGLRTEIKAITELGQKIAEHRMAMSQRSDRIAEIESEIQSIGDTMARLEKQIHDLRSGDGYSRFFEIKNKIGSMSAEKSEIRKTVDLQFSKISRPLGRYSYISSFEKPVRKMMDDMLTNPYDVISQQNKGSVVQILEAVEKSVVSGSISVKDSEKALEQIQETISRLDEFIALKESYSSRVSDLEKDLAVFDSKMLESKEHDLQKARADLANIESVKKKLEGEVRDSSHSLAKSIAEAEAGLARLTGSKVQIK